jgi:hypothetical protein
VERGFLLDRDRGRQAADVIDVGLFHHVKELARISRKRFDISPLPFGIDRVECQTGFTRAGKPRNHNKFVARDINVNVFEVVFTRAAHFDILQLCHGPPLASSRTHRGAGQTLQ